MEFIRGKYDLKNIKYITHLITDMTDAEKHMLMEMPFEQLWNHVWFQQSIQRHTNEYTYAKIKFDALKVGLYVGTVFYNMSKIIQDTPNQYVDPEWGFPKGRRRIRETDVDCAVREFSEETGITKHEIVLDANTKSYEEVFFGTNNVLYRHVYFLARMLNYSTTKIALDMNNINQVREVRAVEWLTYDEILNHIRPHNQERKKMFKQVHCVVAQAAANPI
jgi:8-oxo-dGTP pyrophosphatase MutT (NUDIX family)